MTASLCLRDVLTVVGAWQLGGAGWKQVESGWADIPAAQRLACQPVLRLKRVLGGALELFARARQA